MPLRRACSAAQRSAAQRSARARSLQAAFRVRRGKAVRYARAAIAPTHVEHKLQRRSALRGSGDAPWDAHEKAHGHAGLVDLVRVSVNSILQLPAPPVFSTSMRTCVALLVLKMTERQTMELETDMTDTCSTRTSQFAQVDRSSRVWGRKALTFWELLDATRGWLSSCREYGKVT